MYEANQNDALNVLIGNADNQIVVFLNGSKVYEKSTEGDPSLNEDVNLTGRLKSGRNLLALVGANWSGPWHFKGKVLLKGQDIAEFDQRGGGNGIVWDTTIEIMAK